MIGVVQKIEFTKNGAKKLQIDGGWYFAGKTDVEAVKTGDRIEFTFTEFGEDRGKGRLKGLDKWRPVMDASGKPETASTVTEADILRSVSNVVGNACAAGVVKDPKDLGQWFYEAWKGFHLLKDFEQRDALQKMAPANGAEPEFDDSAELEQMAQQAASRNSGARW